MALHIVLVNTQLLIFFVYVNNFLIDFVNLGFYEKSEIVMSPKLIKEQGDFFERLMNPNRGKILD